MPGKIDNFFRGVRDDLNNFTREMVRSIRDDLYLKEDPGQAELRAKKKAEHPDGVWDDRSVTRGVLMFAFLAVSAPFTIAANLPYAREALVQNWPRIKEGFNSFFSSKNDDTAKDAKEKDVYPKDRELSQRLHRQSRVLDVIGPTFHANMNSYKTTPTHEAASRLNLGILDVSRAMRQRAGQTIADGADKIRHQDLRTAPKTTNTLTIDVGGRHWGPNPRHDGPQSPKSGASSPASPSSSVRTDPKENHESPRGPGF
jgi:hypothetical protein